MPLDSPHSDDASARARANFDNTTGEADGPLLSRQGELGAGSICVKDGRYSFPFNDFRAAYRLIADATALPQGGVTDTLEFVAKAPGRASGWLFGLGHSQCDHEVVRRKQRPYWGADRLNIRSSSTLRGRHQ